MSLVVPNTLEVENLTTILTPPLKIRLYSNNVTPAAGSTTGSFTEVSGGGYAAIPLTFANWSITAGDPSVAAYNTAAEWTFTGPTNAPGTIYGYYVTRDSDNALMWAEKFPAPILPFVPVVGSVVRVAVRFTAQSEF